MPVPKLAAQADDKALMRRVLGYPIFLVLPSVDKAAAPKVAYGNASA